jgi:hypothetical protein
MKAVAIMPTREHALPYTLFHRVMEKIHTEKISAAIDRVFFTCLYSTVVIGTITLFTSTIVQMQGRSIVSMFSEAMSQVQWMTDLL